jgi:hypothetical protein
VGGARCHGPWRPQIPWRMACPCLHRACPHHGCVERSSLSDGCGIHGVDPMEDEAVGGARYHGPRGSQISWRTARPCPHRARLRRGCVERSSLSGGRGTHGRRNGWRNDAAFMDPPRSRQGPPFRGRTRLRSPEAPVPVFSRCTRRLF